MAKECAQFRKREEKGICPNRTVNRSIVSINGETFRGSEIRGAFADGTLAAEWLARRLLWIYPEVESHFQFQSGGGEDFEKQKERVESSGARVRIARYASFGTRCARRQRTRLKCNLTPIDGNGRCSWCSYYSNQKRSAGGPDPDLLTQLSSCLTPNRSARHFGHGECLIPFRFQR